MNWVVFTLDETVGTVPSKRHALDLILHRNGGLPLKARRLRAGAYEYRASGGVRNRVYWVMTEVEARADGWRSPDERIRVYAKVGTLPGLVYEVDQSDEARLRRGGMVRLYALHPNSAPEPVVIDDIRDVGRAEPLYVCERM
jgi:hypothetical protein